ncbi:hypothetical protein CP532_1560, partial [Ophiocordyceps camponoti-leonardi (nom. inval.)]
RNAKYRLRERSIELGSSWLTWLSTLSQLPDAYTLPRQGIDSYLFLRFLRISTIICLTSILVSWPILFALNVTGMGGEGQLESLTYSNINIDKSSTRLYAHCFIAWAIYSFVFYTVVRECIFYVKLRHAYLVSPRYESRISSRTVLFTCISTDLLDKSKLGLIFQQPIRRIRFLRRSNKLDLLVKKRDKVAIKLEKAEVDLIKKVNKARSRPSFVSVSDNGSEKGTLHQLYIPAKKRPLHRLGYLGLVGKPVDAIEWRRSELQRLILETERAQKQWSQGQTDLISAVFVEFSSQADAEEAYEAVNHHLGRKCVKAIGVKPGEIIWKNLEFSSRERLSRKYIVYGFITVFLIIWAFPIAAIGIIEKADKLKTLLGQTWINNLSKLSLALISSFVPPFLMIIFMSPVAPLMRQCAKLAGVPTLCQAELFTHNACFAFQFTQVLIVQTISSSILPTITSIIHDTSAVLPSLRKTLPTASNFYISYFLVENAVAFVIFTMSVGPFIIMLYYKYFARTPRAKFEMWTTLLHHSFGSLLPVFATIVCISLVFSVIAPLVLGPSTLLLATLYFAYRYDIFFVSDGVVDTQGLLYPQALKHLLAGVYVAEICLLSLFAISKAAGPTILMTVFLISSVVFQVTIFRVLDPLIYKFPGNTATKNYVSEGSNSVEMKDRSPSISENIFKFFSCRVDAELIPLLTILAADEQISYTEKVEAEAYLPPCVTSKAPTLWIPADSAGVSKQEVEMTSKIVSITDEGATIDDENRIGWDEGTARPPIWKETIYY